MIVSMVWMTVTKDKTDGSEKFNDGDNDDHEEMRLTADLTEMGWESMDMAVKVMVLTKSQETKTMLGMLKTKMMYDQDRHNVPDRDQGDRDDGFQDSKCRYYEERRHVGSGHINEGRPLGDDYDDCEDNVDEGGLSEGDKYKQDRGYDHDRDDDRGSLVGGGDWDEGGGVK